MSEFPKKCVCIQDYFSEFVMERLHGCSCEQILIQSEGDMSGMWKHGCTKGLLRNWIG